MKTQTDKTQETQKETVQRVQQESSTGGEAMIADNRPVTIAQRKLRSSMDGSENTTNPIQRKTRPERPPAGRAGSRKNNTGLPDKLKTGIENLSGYSMDDVKVHYNSSKPAQLQAHAYAQGTDIHLAPGQQKHLPHEAWHVVQQKQGRVKPTRQLKSKVNINDDIGLEREADVMGEKAIQMQRCNRTSLRANSTHQKTMQRKIKISSGTEELVGNYIVIKAFLDRFVDGENEKITDDNDKLEKIALDRIVKAIGFMEISDLDYGWVDLYSKQGVALLYRNILSYLNENKLTRIVAEDEAAEDEAAKYKYEEFEEDKMKIQQDQNGNIDVDVYDTAFIGAGASIAYALQTLSPNIDHSKYIIIGPEQPWRKKRGPGVVAHPRHMITPQMRHARVRGVDKDNKRDRRWFGIDNTFMDRYKFSDDIDQVIHESGIQRLNHEVTSIERKPEKQNYYCISYDGGGSFYARKIIFGAGVGGHNYRKILKANHNENKDNRSYITREQRTIAWNADEVGGKRVFNMDIWTQVAHALYKDNNDNISQDETNHNPSDITVILSGGNGGIDVAFDALNKGYKVHWIVGRSGATFLPGFFNYAAYLPYLRTLEDSQYDILKNGRNKDLAKFENTKEDELKKAEENMEAIYASQTKEHGGHDVFQGVIERFSNENKRFEGVYFDYAKDLEVTANGVRINAKKSGDSQEEQIDGDVFVYANGQDNKTFELLGNFQQRLKEKLDVNRHFSDDGKAVLGLETEDKTLEVVGATAYRLAGRLRKAARMRDVIDSLPNNVLLNDQLTATRSQIAAGGNFTPIDIDRFVNFATANWMELAIHISSRYPVLADSLRDYQWEDLLGNIIKSRTQKVIKEIPVLALPPNQIAFQEHWKKLLAKMEREQKMAKERWERLNLSSMYI